MNHYAVEKPSVTAQYGVKPAASAAAKMAAKQEEFVAPDVKDGSIVRHSVRAKREKTEIGMHSVRGGTIVGEHEIIFAGRDEVISLKHEAHSKQVFAVGAVNAGVFLCGKPAGLYAMSDLLASL